MGTVFRRSRSEPEPSLSLSNGGTAVLLDVLALAACDLAADEWQLRFALVCCNSRTGGGNDGFDLDQLPWATDWLPQREYVLRVVEAALARRHWDRLPYDPPWALDHLSTFHRIVEGFVPRPPLPDPVGWWTTDLDLERCPHHHLFTGVYADCRLCDVS